MKNYSGISNDSLSQVSLDTETVPGISTRWKHSYFIHCQGKPNSDDVDRKDWIEITGHNPFVMSIGSDATDDRSRFVPEEQASEPCDPIND